MLLPTQKIFVAKRPLALAVATAIALTGTLSQAQESSDGEDSVYEEIVTVTGIVGSLRRAMDIKRNASGIVDAIASEDIGKFPDQNVAESLQRIPGVSIDRNGGEGQYVTVRGSMIRHLSAKALLVHKCEDTPA